MKKPDRKKFAGPGRGHIVTLQDEIKSGRMPVDWQIRLIEAYRLGACDTEIKAKISEWRGRYSVELFDAWMEREEAFAEIVQLGRLYAEAWWKMKGRASIESANFNTASYQMQMFNRYGWANSTKTAHTVDAGPTLTAILKEIGEKSRGFPVKPEDSGRDQSPAE